MKTIGLLGGTSWSSTPLFYNRINQKVLERLGGNHSAEIILRSIDYDEIKSHYADGDWDEIARLLKDRLMQLAALKPDCLIICNNTLHKAYNMIAGSLALPVPLFHMVEESIRTTQRQGMKKLLFLGTRFTMEDGFFTDSLRRAGFEADIPEAGDRDLIQSVQTPLSLGQINPAFNAAMKNMLGRYKGYDGLVLGCTELPLVITATETDIPIINTIDAVCDAAVNFALEL